jgi:serine/threonine-protein kinase
MSPEQIVGKEDVDIRADIYSLGATLYHMVTGQPPFPGPAVDDVLKAHLREKITPPDSVNRKLSSGIGEVIEFMMAKNRHYRYQTPDDLIIDLECLLAEEPPKLARQKLSVSSLEQLATGIEEEEEGPAGFFDRKFPIMWFLCLLTILTLSLIGNLILMIYLLR